QRHVHGCHRPPRPSPVGRRPHRGPRREPGWRQAEDLGRGQERRTVRRDGSGVRPMSGPLEGVRVVDLTTIVVGPICTRTLADYGAEVIKVEAPGGDLLRTMAEGSRNPGMSGKFINFNRNKRSIGLDIKKPEGLEALLRLIDKTDVFVSNVRPDALARAGLDYENLSKRNPRLIQSLSGVAGTIARATGEPRFVPMVMTDHTSGLIAAQAIGFALFRREKTGKGEAIDVPMLENMASFVSSEHLGAATFDPP